MQSPLEKCRRNFQVWALGPGNFFFWHKSLTETSLVCPVQIHLVVLLQECVRFLLMVLRKLDKRRYKHQPHVRDLLVRLDFNGHIFEESDGDR